MRVYKSLVLKNGVTPFALSAVMERDAQDINSIHDQSVLIRVRVDVQGDRIIISFVWPPATRDENRVMQRYVVDFMSNGFRSKVSNEILRVSNFKGIVIRRNGRQITNRYSCIVTAV